MFETSEIVMKLHPLALLYCTAIFTGYNYYRSIGKMMKQITGVTPLNIIYIIRYIMRKLFFF